MDGNPAEKNKRKFKKDASDWGGVFFAYNFSNSHDFQYEKGIMEVTMCHLCIGDSNKASRGASHEEMRMW